jgi:hypothetical protein
MHVLQASGFTFYSYFRGHNFYCDGGLFPDTTFKEINQFDGTLTMTLSFAVSLSVPLADTVLIL